MADKAFDAHCHLFTLEYLLRELLAILDSAVQKQYPVYPQPSFLTAASQDHRGFFQKLTDTIGSIAGLCEVLAESCAQHLAKDCAGYSAHQADDLITLPLMMDIFYIFRHGDVADTDQGATFTELANSLIAPLLAQVPAALKPVVKQKMLDLIEEFSTKTHPSPLAALTLPDQLKIDYTGVELSPGYQVHMEELVALRVPAPDMVLPFLGVDPRRPGIETFVKNNVGPNRPFVGVKIYPPLGYLPTENTLTNIFAYCEAQAIPVTAHCQMNSFYNFFSPLHEEYKALAAPQHWEPVLKNHPRLRLNLAHCGGSDAVAAYLAQQNLATNWTKRILDFMDIYPNVYADIAAFTDDESARNVAVLYAQNPILRQRLMFGTDYVICLLPGHENLGGRMSSYYGYYFRDLDEATRTALFFDNPRAFLGLPASIATAVAAPTG